MKNFLFLVSFMLLATLMQAQDSWKISLNKKTVLISNESNEMVNIKNINSTDWKKNGYLEVSYKEITPNTMLHSLQFNDESGNQLLAKDSVTTTKIPIGTLRKLFAGKKQMKIFLIISPSNPMIGMPSRMIHLVTLKLP
jgi:hypothetical protein